MVLIVGSRLGDRIGRRRAFSIGLALFTLSSAACGVAGSPVALVVARLAQGTGAALLLPNVFSRSRMWLRPLEPPGSSSVMAGGS